MVGSFKDIDTKIIARGLPASSRFSGGRSFFKKYPILGVKSLDFEAFCEAAEIVRSKRHSTLEGIEKLTQIKNTMNKQRYISSSHQGLNGKRFFSTTTRRNPDVGSQFILKIPASQQAVYLFLKRD
jgi:hypothetical protein